MKLQPSSALLELLNISGCIITIDAMGTQHQIADGIRALGADYVLALKGNHPTLFEQVKQWFETAVANKFEGIEYSYDLRVESGHHRTEKRQVWAVTLAEIDFDLYKQSQWSRLQTIVMVIRTRHHRNKTTREVMFYLTSLPPLNTSGLAIRQHWSIENQLHARIRFHLWGGCDADSYRTCTTKYG
ncbi:ISAs1 family transposase [Moorena sp. SIO4A5]|uniref:ISAs1 family transposase n=1 Tax=unclassified Moorena TaxID=2683338 RepID=UPI0034300698